MTSIRGYSRSLEISQRVLYHSLIGLNIRTIDYTDVYKDREKNVYSSATIREATVIPISDERDSDLYSTIL